MPHLEDIELPGPFEPRDRVPDIDPDDPLQFPDRPGPVSLRVFQKQLRNTNVFDGDPFPWPRGVSLFGIARNRHDQDIIVTLHGNQHRDDGSRTTPSLKTVVVASGGDERVFKVNLGAGNLWMPWILTTVQARSPPTTGGAEVIIGRIGV